MKKLTDKTLVYIVLSIHTIFFIVLIIFLNIQKNKNITKYLTNLYLTNKVAFKREIDLLNKNMDLLEKILIDKPILEIVNSAYINKEKAREKLIKKFYSKYVVLKNNGFYLIHFHLNNGYSFLRLHNLKKYDDYLLDFRPSIKYVQHSKKIFHGFEIGRGVGGFRSVYPLMYNNKIIGSFEISFSIKNLIEYMFAKQHIAMVIDKHLLQKRVFVYIKNQALKCKLNKNYYSWGNVDELFKKQYNIDFNKPVNIVSNYVIFSYPIYNIQHKQEGFIINVLSMSQLKTIKEIDNNFYQIVFILILLYVGIFFVIVSIYFYRQIKKRAEIDHLTQVLNRDGCEKYIKKLNNYILLILDIDYFKRINDTYGHDKGDIILKEVANLIYSNVRKDDIVCRWGGEEFLVILPNTDINDGIKVANKIRNIIKSHKISGVNITISIGVSIFNGNFDDTFKTADNNLYKAKKEGRDKVVYL